MWRSIWPGFTATHPEPPEQNAAARHREHENAVMAKSTMVDSASNRNGLRASSNTQQRRIFASFFASKPEQNASRDALIGQAIDPKVAEKYMHAVEFDGIGRVVAFKKRLSERALGTLHGAVIKSLTQTNTLDERAAARPGTDCLIQFMHLMQNARGEMAQELLGQSRALWMSGKLSDDAVGEFLIEAALKLQDTPSLQSTAVMLANAVNRPKTATERNDNMYGRKFESEFVHALIKNPPAATLEATRRIGQALLADFDKVHPSNLPATKEALQDLAASVEPRPWSSKTPDLEQFMKAPTRDKLEAMLLNVRNGFDILKIQLLISKVSETFADKIEWKERADLRYESVVQAARKTRPFQEVEPGLEADSSQSKKAQQKKLGLDIATSGYGIGLASHPGYEKQDGFHPAKDSSYGRMIPDMALASGMEGQALRHGHAIVTGASGNANLLAYLSLGIGKEHSDFSTGQAALASMMFLVFDGGHSLNEVMAVYTGVMASENLQPDPEDIEASRAMEKRLLANMAPPDTARRLAQRSLADALDKKRKNSFAQHLENYHLDYRTVVDLGKHKGNEDEVRVAMETALSKTVDYFNENSYYSSQNSERVQFPHSNFM